ncbi:MAG: metal ABC transporter permease [Rickettsiaceae bacterium]|nr:metal ABC transporter permease [Rickettsiaceae bacterium]
MFFEISATLIAVSLILGALGPIVLWQKLEIIGDSLAHSLIFALVVSYLTGIDQLYANILIATIFTIFLQYNAHNIRDNNMSRIIILNCFLTSITIIFADFADGALRLREFIVGHPFASNMQTVVISFIVLTVVFTFIAINYKNIVLCSIDEDMAVIKGLNVPLFQFCIKLILSISIAITVNIVGILLMVAMLIIPASIARLISRSPKEMIILSIFISLVSGILSAYCSIGFDIPYGPLLAIILSTLYLYSLFLKS